MSKPKIALVTNSETNCGVHAYAQSTFDILKHSQKYDYEFVEVSGPQAFIDWAMNAQVNGLIFNHHPATLAWLSEFFIENINIPQYVITGHDTTSTFAGIKHHFVVDPQFKETATHSGVARPLGFYPDITYRPPSGKLNIGSFGFGQVAKNFPSIIEMVNQQFSSEPVNVNILMPYGAYVDSSGALAHFIAQQCYALAKPNVTVNISHEFIKDKLELIQFLNGNDINIFYYAEQPGRGPSSCIDHALACRKPIGVADTTMFKHVSHVDEICVDKHSILSIIARGISPLEQFYTAWNNENLIKSYENYIDKAFNL
jgi:hypothetical protein